MKNFLYMVLIFCYYFKCIYVLNMQANAIEVVTSSATFLQIWELQLKIHKFKNSQFQTYDFTPIPILFLYKEIQVLY